MADGTKVREAVAAGQFYPADKNELKRMIDRELKKTKQLPESQKLRALIVPHAGYLYSGSTAAWGYKQLMGRGKEEFVLLGPSHRYAFEDLVADETDFWETPLGRMKYVTAVKSPLIQVGEVPHKPEHSLEVQIPFLQSAVGNQAAFTGFLTGIIKDYEKVTTYFSDNYSQSTYIVSSDLSHYLTAREASKVDMDSIKAMERLDTDYFLREGNTACGRTGIAILLNLAKLWRWRVQAIHYETSATATGDLNRVVGYASVAFYEV